MPTATTPPGICEKPSNTVPKRLIAIPESQDTPLATHNRIRMRSSMYDPKDAIWDMTCPTPIHSTVAPAYYIDMYAAASCAVTFLMRLELVLEHSGIWNIEIKKNTVLLAPRSRGDSRAKYKQ